MATEKDRQKVWTDTVNNMLLGRYNRRECSIHQLIEGTMDVANAVLAEFDKNFPATKK